MSTTATQRPAQKSDARKEHCVAFDRFFEKGQLSEIDTIDDFEEEPIKEGEESKIEGKIDPTARSSHPVSHSEWI